ncbi:hypothetical protein [Streptomyces sp. NPDC048411]|uniref:hypothetical protein n=1 Tax=Streptomyces sp. NPDC048411 TaxID=3157206 RepID=UPI003453B681
MPSLGSISSTCVPGATEEVQAFACALKRLIPYVEPGATMQVKAGVLAISPSLLSHWLSGRRLPVPKALRKLYDLAVDGALCSPETSLSCSFVELDGLLQAARKSMCRRCRGGCVCSEGKGSRLRATVGEPLRRSSLSAAGRESPGGTAALRRSPDTSQQDASLPERLAEMPPADQVNLLWSLGVGLSEGEIGAAASSLASAGMTQEMEIILRAAESAGKDSVKIVMAFSGAR